MTSIEEIITTIGANMKSVSLHQDYPCKPGLYAFSLAKGSILTGFCESNQIIYVGKAEHSLKQRDLNTHFKDGRTGNSTLRRSIGAILKNDFKAMAFSRNGTLNFPNIDNYKFNSQSETKISEWMNNNLLIGYWEYYYKFEKAKLATIEEQLILALKPSLDLDKRTIRFNKYAQALTTLRQICKNEARQNVIKGKVFF